MVLTYALHTHQLHINLLPELRKKVPTPYYCLVTSLTLTCPGLSFAMTMSLCTGLTSESLVVWSPSGTHCMSAVVTVAQETDS